MAVWIHNLINALQDKPVVILHGNVRDRYIDKEGRVYDNLTNLLEYVAEALPLRFSERVIYDMVANERRVVIGEEAQPATELFQPQWQNPNDELAATQPPPQRGGQKAPPSRVLANWLQQISAPTPNRLFVMYYLDKVVAYRNSYLDEEKERLLWLEKLIENITPNHRLILVALQDTMIPLELYINAPTVRVLPIPLPDKRDRLAYFSYRLEKNELPAEELELAVDLTDGLFLHDLDAITKTFQANNAQGRLEIRRLINRYRIGEQVDHWSTLNIERLSNAMTWFVEQESVKGQNEAIQRVIDMLTLARAGLTGMASGTRAKPRGVLFFAGPTGVGKTFVAKKLAKFLFSTEEAFLRFDMSEFKENHTVSKLIGSPPGYVGFEQGGMLTNAVREKPFMVILFDEIEKAHPKIFDIFLQLLDEGRLTDSRGQTVFFTETVVIFTSNIGTRTTNSKDEFTAEQQQLESILNSPDTQGIKKQRSIREHFGQAVEHFFMFEISRPELLNRIGNNIIPFNYIHDPKVQKDIIHSHLQRIREEFQDKYRTNNYRLQPTDELVHWLVQRYNKRFERFGARAITSAIEREIMLPLARAVLRAEYFGHKEQQFTLEKAQDKERIVVQVS